MTLSSLHSHDGEEGGNDNSDSRAPQVVTEDASSMMEKMLEGIGALSAQMVQVTSSMEQRFNSLTTSVAQQWDSINHQFSVLAQRQLDMDDTLSVLVGEPTELTIDRRDRIVSMGVMQDAVVPTAPI